MLKFSSCRPNKISPSPIQESQPSSTPPSLYATAMIARENAGNQRILEQKNSILMQFSPKIEETLALVAAENFEASLLAIAKEGREGRDILKIDAIEISSSLLSNDFQSIILKELMKNPQFVSKTQIPGRKLEWLNTYIPPKCDNSFSWEPGSGSFKLCIRFIPEEPAPVTKKSSCHLL